VVVAAQVGDGARALAEVPAVADLIGGAVTPDQLGHAGVALDQSGALFAQAGFPTVVLPVRDATALRAELDRRRPDRNADVTQHRGHDVYSWPQGGWTISWVLLDGWLVAHAAPDAATGWLDAVLAAPGGGNLGADPELERAQARGRAALGSAAAPPDVLLLVRTDRLARDLQDWAGAPRGLAGCVERAAQLTPIVHGAADLGAGGGDGWLGADLGGAQAEAVRAHIAPAAPPGFYAYRAAAPLAFAWTVELPWLEKQRAALGCPFAAGRITDPARAMTGMSGPRAYHGAATQIDIDDMSGSGALFLVLTDRDLVSAQLERIPARGLFERSRRIHGHDVRVLSLPGLSTILYLQEKDRFTIAFGAKVMEQVLAPGSDEPGNSHRPTGDEIAMVAVEPGRLRNLADLLARAMPRAEARALADRLRRYQKASVSLALEGDTLTVRAQVRLRK
jgi:hypothetical protein